MISQPGHANPPHPDSIKALLDELDVNKISSAHDLYSGMPAPYAKGFRDGFNTAKEMIKADLEALIHKAVIEGRIDELQQLVANTLNPAQVGGHFIHAEVEEFAAQLTKFIVDRLNDLKNNRGESND